MTEAEQELESVLLEIKSYCREFNVSPARLRDLFHVGIAAASVLLDGPPFNAPPFNQPYADSLPSAGENKVA